jgi:hypothetical protein
MMKGHQKDVEKMAKGFWGDPWVLFYFIVDVQVNSNLKPKEKITKNSKIGSLKKIPQELKTWKGTLGRSLIYFKKHLKKEDIF